MKGIVASLILCIAVITASAQKAVKGNEFIDNWSVGFSAGGTTPLTHSAFFKNMQVVLGVGLDKQVTPVLDLGFGVMTGINTTPSRTIFDNTSLSVSGILNLSNLFGGYTSAPRLFEVETVADIDWLHYVVNSEDDFNSMLNKSGLSFNFNLGEEEAWTLAFRPALVYDMSADRTDNVCFSTNRVIWGFIAGLKCRFSCNNGKHYFTIVKPCNQSEIDILDDQVSNMYREADDNAVALKNADQKAAGLEKTLNNCRNQTPKVITETVTSDKKTLKSVVTSHQGGASVESSQTLNVERITTYSKNHKNATVSIKGYASPEGDVDVNARITRQHAESVKNMLVNRHRIAANRVAAEDQDVGNTFEEPDWNRVSICTISED